MGWGNRGIGDSIPNPISPGILGYMGYPIYTPHVIMVVITTTIPMLIITMGITTYKPHIRDMGECRWYGYTLHPHHPHTISMGMGITTTPRYPIWVGGIGDTPNWGVGYHFPLYPFSPLLGR